MSLGSAEVWRDALWLAGRDARRTWLSFPVAALVALVFGVYSVVLYSMAFGNEDGRWIGEFALDLWFLALVAVLGVNFLFNKDYYYRIREDNLSKRLAFLRGLPISVGRIVFGRVAIMLLTLACASPFFFLTPYLMYGGLRERISLAEYLCFVAFWLGYALFMVGVLVFVWLGLSWETERKILFSLPLFYLLLALVSSFFFEAGLVAGILGVARDHSPILATAPVVGIISLFFWARAAGNGLRRRDLG